MVVIDTGPEKALLVAIRHGRESADDLELVVEEMTGLLHTAGVELTETIRVQRGRSDPRTFVGSGKVEEIRDILSDLEIDAAVFSVDLTPSQQRNLETALDAKIIDRTAVILDIFAQHAHTSEGILQVELAQLKYLLPRLAGRGVELSRLGGGIGTRGPGETKLEMDRRRIRRRIRALEEQIAEIAKQRQVRRGKRQDFFSVSLLGYTNAGKSSLLNALTLSDAYVQDQLFATLDSMTRRLPGKDIPKIVLTDTVGFIDHLPPQLIAAFSSTLEEVGGADLLLHIVDASTPKIERHLNAVEKIIADLGWSDKEILLVFNKADLLEIIDRSDLERRYPEAVFVSAQTNAGLDRLVSEIAARAVATDSYVVLQIPYSRGDLIDRIHREARITAQEYTADGVIITAQSKPALISELTPFLLKNKDKQA